MLRTSTAFLAVASLFLSTISQAQVSDVIGDVAVPCIDIVQTDISATAETISATLWAADEFCPKAQYQFHVDVDSDGMSDYGYMAKLDKDGEFSFHGSPDLLVEVDEGGFGITFGIPVDELLDEYGVPVDEVAVWFRTHFDDEADLFPDKYEDVIDLPLGGEVLKVVGPEGGIVVDDDPTSPTFGTNIVIPVGSLEKPYGISLSYVPDVTMSYNSDVELGVPQATFTILPEGLSFDPPVTISVPIPDEDQDGFVDGTDVPVLAGDIFYLFGNEWQRVGTEIDVESGFLTAQVSHFSDYASFWTKWKEGSSVLYFVEDVPDNQHYGWSSFVNEIDNAYHEWQSYIGHGITFTRTGSRKAAHIIVTATDLCDASHTQTVSCKADGRAARPYQQPLGELNKSWVVHFNTDNNDTDFKRLWYTGPYDQNDDAPVYWDAPSSYVGYEMTAFLRVALHEFGHTMGLRYYQNWHIWNKLDDLNNTSTNGYRHVMRTDLGVKPQLTELDRWDIDRLRDLYPVSAPNLSMNVSPTSFVFSLSGSYVPYSGTITNWSNRTYGPYPISSRIILQNYITQNGRTCPAAGWSYSIGPYETITSDHLAYINAGGSCSQTYFRTGAATLTLELRVAEYGIVTFDSWQIYLVN